MVTVSILLTVRNVENYIEECLKSILSQTFEDFEVIVVDDDSVDHTKRLVSQFVDRRIKYHRNERRLGLTRNRNRALKYAIGKYVFFTDGDCIVSKNWLAEGLKYFSHMNCVGVEGKICYVSENYEPVFSDHICTNYQGSLFMTGSMAYLRSIIEKVGGFDEKFSYHEDRDIALRIKRYGAIPFNPNMIVYVQKETLTPKALIGHTDIIKNRVYLFKRFCDKTLITWRIVDPLSLAKLMFPPLFFGSLFSKNFKDNNDFILFPYAYVQLVLERLNLWHTCVKERVFLI